MKLGITGFAVLLLVLGLSGRLKAQYVYSYAEASYDAGCNCVQADTSFDYDTIADQYYFLTFDSELADVQATISGYSTDPAGWAWTVDNPQLEDEYVVKAQVGGPLDSQYESCATGTCGQALKGGCPLCCNSTVCPADDMPLTLNYSTGASVTPTCGTQFGDLDSLIAEYGSSHLPDPGCADFTQAVGGSQFTIPQLPYLNAILFSQGGTSDITDWGLFNPLLINGIYAMNTTKLPAGAPTDMQIPYPITSVYRTPAHNATIPGSVPNEGHIHGIAVDIQTTQMQNAASDPSDAASSWLDMAGWAQATALKQFGGSQPVCIEPPNFNLQKPKYWHLHIDWRPQAGMPLNPCTSAWTTNAPTWAGQ